MAEFERKVGGINIVLDGYNNSNNVTGTEIGVQIRDLSPYTFDRTTNISTTPGGSQPLIPAGVNAEVTTADGMADVMAARMVQSAKGFSTDSTSYTALRRKLVEEGTEEELANFDKAWSPGGAIEQAVAAQLRADAAKDASQVIRALYESQGPEFDASKVSDEELNKLIQETIEKQDFDSDFWVYNGRNSRGTGAQWVKAALKNDVVSRQARQEAAQKTYKKDKDKFNLTAKSGIWNNSSALKEQVWLFKYYMPNWIKETLPLPIPPGEDLFRPTPAWKSDCQIKFLFAGAFDSGGGMQDDAQFNSSLLAKVLSSVYVFLPPSLHALLVPKIEVYIEFHAEKGHKAKILRFDEHLSNEDLIRLMSGEAAEIPGVGLMSIDLEDKASNAAEIRKSYVLNLKVYSTSVKDFAASSKDGRATFRDLWYNVNTKIINGKPNNILRINIGWKVPHVRSIMEAANCNKERAEEYVLALERNTLSYRLYLHKYNLNFNQNGSVEFEGTYQAAVTADIFHSDIFPIPRESSAVIKYTEYDSDGNPTDYTYSIRDAIERIDNLQLQKETVQEQISIASDVKSDTQEKSEKEKLQDDLKIINRGITRLREEVKLERFQGFTKKLFEEESIFVVETKLNSSGQLVSTTSSTPSEDKTKKVAKAARAAVRNVKNRKGTDRLEAIKYHNAATEAEDGVHRIGFVFFADLFRSIIDTINENTFKKAPEYKKKSYEFHLGRAEIRYREDSIFTVNVGYLMIPITRITTFMQSIFAAIPDDDTPFPFSRFFEMLVNDLVVSALNSSDFFMSQTSESTKRKYTSSLHKGHIRQYSMSKKYLDDLWSHEHSVYNASGVKALLRSPYAAPLYGSDLQDGDPDAAGYPDSFIAYSTAIRTVDPNEPVKDVYYVHIDSIAPVFLNGTLKENLAYGIHHFFLGSDTGILKEISFAQKDIEGRQEALMLSASSGKENIFHFDANLKLMGNALFSNGDMIYIDPALGRITENGSAPGEILGMGGYYNVFKVNHSISREGYETDIEAKWNNFAGLRAPKILRNRVGNTGFQFPIEPPS